MTNFIKNHKIEKKIAFFFYKKRIILQVLKFIKEKKIKILLDQIGIFGPLKKEKTKQLTFIRLIINYDRGGILRDFQ